MPRMVSFWWEMLCRGPNLVQGTARSPTTGLKVGVRPRRTPHKNCSPVPAPSTGLSLRPLYSLHFISSPKSLQEDSQEFL